MSNSAVLTTYSPTAVEAKAPNKTVLWLRVFARNRPAVLGAFFLVVVVTACVIGPFVIGTDPNAQNLDLRRAGPSGDAWFGRDAYGRDIFIRVLVGGRSTLLAAAGSVAVSALIGSALGIVAGFYGRWRESLIMRAMDLMLSFPYFLLALLIVAMAGSGLRNAALAVAIAYIPQFARVARSAAASVRHNEYIEAAQVAGVPNWKTLLTHVVPNVSAPLLVLATTGMAMALTGVASLSFLGLGAQPPAPEWGAMLAAGKDSITNAAHISLFPGLAIVFTVLGLNLVGDGLQDVFNPKNR